MRARDNVRYGPMLLMQVLEKANRGMVTSNVVEPDYACIDRKNKA